MDRNAILLLLMLFIYFVSAINNINDWPTFYTSGQISHPKHPTKQILTNLTHYRSKWEDVKNDLEFDETYSMTFAWDCTSCDQCFKANKYIIVEDDVIVSLETSILNDKNKFVACSTNKSNIIQQYKSIDELYDILIKWVEEGLNDPVYLIMQLMLDPVYYYPSNVKLSSGQTYIAWDIVCFEPSRQDDETKTCDYDPQHSSSTNEEWAFWISKEMQSLLGWSMIFLILIACSLGYCINWLKKKKTEKIEAWREKEEIARQAKIRARLAKKEQREKEKQEERERRRASRARHKARLASKRDSKKHQQRYKNLENNENSSENESDPQIEIEEHKLDDGH